MEEEVVEEEEGEEEQAQVHEATPDLEERERGKNYAYSVISLPFPM